MSNGAMDAPVVSKPDVFAELERVTTTPATVRRIFDALHAQEAHTAAEMADLAERFGLCSPAVATHMRVHWGEGTWFGPVMDEVNVKFRRAAHLLCHAERLSAWWVRGGSDRVFIEVYRVGSVVHLVLHSPHVPPSDWGSAKVPLHNDLPTR